jgi:hypothetical protein
VPNVKIDDLKLKKSISQDISKIDKESQEDDDKESQQEDDDKETQENEPILMKKTMKKHPFQKLHRKEFKRTILRVRSLEIKMQEWKQEGNSHLTQNMQCCL